VTQAGFQMATLPLETKPAAGLYEEECQQRVGTSVIADADATIAVIRNNPVHSVIVDHYGLGVAWEEKIRPYTKRIIAIDDLANRYHCADYLLDQNLVAEYQSRYLGLLSKTCAQLLGPDFALLQPEYSLLRPHTASRTGPVKRILIYFGESDQARITQMAIEAFLLLNRPDIELDVVINNRNPNAGEIVNYSNLHANICIHTGLPTLANLIQVADLAIGAAGSSSWERCCLGLPSIVITLADNQEDIAAELDARGAVRWLGHYNTVSVAYLASSLKSLVNEASLKEWSVTCSSLIDGKGAYRVSEILALSSASSLSLHLANEADEKFLLNLANDPLVRENAFVSNQISSEEHRCWFYSRLKNPDRSRIYIARTSEGVPVGQVRLERLDFMTWELHYSLAAYARGHGLGQALIRQALGLAKEFVSTSTVLAKVKRGNSASLRVFEKLGFKSTEQSDCITFIKQLVPRI
jgi:UDP-2,4-diacetamido-2,4,6-trideoxy-beta-L-altropyranose hydrolase